MKIINASAEFMTDINPDEVMLKLGDIAGICYKGYTNPGTDLETAYRIVENCVKNHHDSILEHVSVTIKFITSRDITHELVRHRLASFTQESTRYCNYSKDKFDNEIKVIDIKSLNPDMITDEAYDRWKSSCETAEKKYMSLLELGVSAQLARDVLPNSLATTIVVTANLREWKHILKLRCDKVAHPGIQQIMVPVLLRFQKLLPAIFNDIEIDDAVKAKFGKSINTDLYVCTLGEIEADDDLKFFIPKENMDEITNGESYGIIGEWLNDAGEDYAWIDEGYVSISGLIKGMIAVVLNYCPEILDNNDNAFVFEPELGIVKVNLDKEGKAKFFDAIRYSNATIYTYKLSKDNMERVVGEKGDGYEVTVAPSDWICSYDVTEDSIKSMIVMNEE